MILRHFKHLLPAFTATMLIAGCNSGSLAPTAVSNDAVYGDLGDLPTEVETAALCINRLFPGYGRQHQMILVSNRSDARYATFTTGFLTAHETSATGVFSYLFSDRIDFEPQGEGSGFGSYYLAQPFDANIPDYFDIRIDSNMQITWNDHTWGTSGVFPAKCANQMLTFDANGGTYLISISEALPGVGVN